MKAMVFSEVAVLLQADRTGVGLSESPTVKTSDARRTSPFSGSIKCSKLVR